MKRQNYLGDSGYNRRCRDSLKNGPHLPAAEAGDVQGATRTGCGAGPVRDGAVFIVRQMVRYIDHSYDDMKNKLGADGDFAQGYVIPP